MLRCTNDELIRFKNFDSDLHMSSEIRFFISIQTPLPTSGETSGVILKNFTVYTHELKAPPRIWQPVFETQREPTSVSRQ